MRYFAISYLSLTALLVLVILFLQLPNTLAFFAMTTFGRGLFLAWGLLILTFWLVVFTPSVLGAVLDWRVGAWIAAVTMVTLLSASAWLPEPDHEGVPLLQEPQAAQGPVNARSVQMDVATLPRDLGQIADPIAAMLLQNQDLDWVRFQRHGSGTASLLYMRRDGVLYLEKDDHGQAADVIVQRPGLRLSASSETVPQNWQRAPLSPWRIDHVRGYLIHSGRGSGALARNLSLKISRAEFPFWMQFTQVTVSANSPARAEFIRYPFAEIAHDPDRHLEDDLYTLGLIALPDPSSTKQGGDMPANLSEPDAVDAAIQQLLDDPELSGLAKAATRQSLGDLQRQVLAEFTRQLEQRVAIAERINLITLVHRSHLPLRSELVMELALEEPALMQSLVDRYYLDLAQKADRQVIKRVGDETLAPLARAIGHDQQRFREAFLDSRGFERKYLTEMIFLFDLDDPYGLLVEVFEPFPPVSEFEQRLEPSFRQGWKDEQWVEHFLELVQSGWTPDKSEDQENADLAFLQVLKREDVPDSIVLDFTRRWVLTRITPIHHDPHIIKLALRKLDEIGAEELHSALRGYFQDLESTLAKSE